MKILKKSLFIVSVLTLATYVFAAPAKLVVGFSQGGSESEWRNANIRSIQDSFNGDPATTLIYSDAKQNKETQIADIRTFIASKVNVILFSAVGETGYGPVLQEAHNAGIPVIMIDRDIAKQDRKYRVSVIRSGYVKEGEKAGIWLADYLTKMGLDDGKKTVNIVQIEGSAGSAPAIQRAAGFAKILLQHSNWKISSSRTGDFTVEGGKSAMENFLKSDKTIQVLYAQNDAMALGAEQAIQDAGLKPGKDIIVIGVDGVEGALDAIVAGDQNASVECSPFVGPQALQAVKDIVAGKPLPDRIWTIEGVFDKSNAAEALPNHQY